MSVREIDIDRVRRHYANLDDERLARDLCYLLSLYESFQDALQRANKPIDLTGADSVDEFEIP